MHCPVEKLADVQDVLDEVRAFGEFLREPKPSIFYFKSQAFLHFHSKDDARWAHVRGTDKWLELPLAAKPTQVQKKAFIKAAKRCYDELSKAKKTK